MTFNAITWVSNKLSDEESQQKLEQHASLLLSGPLKGKGEYAQEKAIMNYRNKFIQLVIDIANENGGILAIHTKYEFTILTPELLKTMGYENIRYLKGSPEHTEGFGGTILHAIKGEEELILKSANALVPWVNIRKIPIENEVTVEDILNKHLIF